MERIARVSVNGNSPECGNESDVRNGSRKKHLSHEQQVRRDFTSTSGFVSESTSSDSDSPSESIPNYQFQHHYRSTSYISNAITHLFLPKRIPDSVRNNLIDIEDWILHTFYTSFCELNFSKLHQISKMFETWKFTQPKVTFDQDRFVQRFCYELRKMESGDTVPLYVRKQNSTILITKRDDKTYQVETFRPCLPSETIMSNVGSIRATYPETSEVIKNIDLLKSEVLVKQLHDLSVEEFEMSMHTSHKAGKEFLEYREVPEPFFVSDWFLGLLVPSAQHNLPKIQIVKKIRDNINCKRSAQAIPFRRSGLWMSIKVALHLKLVHLIGNENDAKILYKTVLLRFYTEVCRLYLEDDLQIDIDLCSQLIAKIGRRVKKLQKMSCDKKSEHAKEIVSSWSTCLKFAYSIVRAFHEEMKTTLNEVSFPSAIDTIALITRSKDELHQDLLHDIPWLDEYINDVNSKNKLAKDVHFTNFTAENLSTSLQLQRFRTLDSILTSSRKQFGSKDSPQGCIWLHDTGKFMKTSLNDENDSKLILDVLTSYVKIAIQRNMSAGYENPVGFSQMQLVALKAFHLLDKLATKQFPLLRQYNAGIDVSCFDKLLLPHVDDIKLLEELIDYFTERDRVAYHPGILETNDIQSNTFSVRLAQDNEDMINLHRKMYADTEQCIADKFSEVENVKIKCKELLREMKKRKSCTECKYDKDHLELKSEKCQQCSKLDQDLEKERLSVSIYERPLPDEEHFQQAVIFELLVPPEISNLREALALLKFDVLHQPMFRGKQKRSNASTGPLKWIEYKNIRSYKPNNKVGDNKMVNLCSKLLPTSNTHYSKIRNPDVLSSEITNNDFIVSNGLNCIYHFKSQLTEVPFESFQDTKALCTFQLSSTEDKHELYSPFQWALDGTSHNQNRIIAENSMTYHPELISFGSLRAGHRIQLMNLFRYMTNRELALEKEPVLALVLQTLWQLGPRNKSGVRESHLDLLEETGFALEFLEMLEKLMDGNDTNYANPLILLTIVVTIIRILELNMDEDCRKKCSQLLKKSRRYVATWWRMIDDEISQFNNTSKVDCEDDEIEATKQAPEDINKIKMQIVICSALSFNASNSVLFSHVIQDSEDVLHWFCTLSRLYQLTKEEQCQKGLSKFSQILLSLAKSVPLKLDLDKKLTSSDLIIKSLHSFSCENWDKAASCITDDTQLSWKSNNSSSNVVFGEYIEENGHSHLLTFDLILGSFLVNGYPQSGLPSKILQNPLYELYFRQNKLRVQGYHPRCVRTIETFHGKHYEFATFSISDKLKIREIHEDRILELLDPEKFRIFIGDDNIDGYLPWVDVDKQEVLFRRCPLHDSDYSVSSEFKLFKDEKSNRWQLFDERLHQFILSRKSKGFEIISNALSRIEIEKYVNIVLDEKTDSITAKLPRYHLNFNLKNGSLYSLEYISYKITSDQSAKRTLIGLQHGLLLDNDEFSKDLLDNDNQQPTSKYTGKRLLLVPHGRLNLQLKPNQKHNHQQVSIELGQLRQPPFFVFEFDPVLKRLKAGKSKAAWLYLAALHGATSFSIPDPFTEVTGTEAAVQILQSGFVWSSSPYDDESLSTLRIIKRFSPRRYFYGHGMQPKNLKNVLREQMETTEWPIGLPSMIAYDGYAIIVDKLLEVSYRLSALYPETPPPREDHDKSSEKLRVRSYFAHLNSYNKVVAVNPNYFKTSIANLNQTGSVEECTSRKVMSENFQYNLNELLCLSQARFMNVLQEANDSRRKCGLSSFLITEEPLLPSLPIPSHKDVPIKEILTCKFRENWLKFYTMAATWKGPEKIHGVTMFLSTLAYRGAPMEHLINLHNISVLAETMDFPSLPESLRNYRFENPTKFNFDGEALKSFLLDRVIRIKYEGGNARLQIYQDQMDKIDNVVAEIKKLWPCEKIPKKKLDEIYVKNTIWCYDDIKEVGNIVTAWSQNLKLKLFVENIEKILNKFYEHFPKQQNSEYQFDKMSEVVFEVRVEPPAESAVEKMFEDIGTLAVDGNLDEAAIIFYSGSGFQETNVESLLDAQREQCISKIESYTHGIHQSMLTGASKQVILMAGIAPRTAPSLLLKYLLYGIKKRGLNNSFLKSIGALAVLWTELKRFNRCLALKCKDSSCVSTSTELKSELENPGHENWSPVDHPEWLLLELELDIMIRPIQVDVAKQMMHMPDGKNGVMQLNMGEGKTSVIVPMICSTLANEESLCRVTVLQSIFKTNQAILTFAVGGLLNRKVYIFPCRRDMNIDQLYLENILAAYQECLKLNGVVLTLPEYRLSFRQMAYDKTLKSYPEVGVKFIEVESGLRKYARDILDESDELLSVKYQLVYTIGTQVPVDGGKLRWITCQKLLYVVQSIAERFYDKAGPSVVEFHPEKQLEHPEQFSFIRLLDSNSGMEDFLSMLADEVLKDFKITERQKQVVKKFFTQEKISLENFKFVMSLFKNDACQLDEVRILSGYFRRDILSLALTKRWRVEYGVDSIGQRRMAVPFRAKDFAAERTEFGHPDLAIILTQLSYYYSGLSDSHLEECFDVLKTKPEADMIYSIWLTKIAPEKVPKFLSIYSGLNFQNGYQRSRMFDMLRKHKSVIDFWLSHKVYPHESKQFPGKIVMTAWDLCHERSRHPISGFSGTNDSSLLLPLSISQQDLTQLKGTNLKMEKTLLRPENGNHKGFTMGLTCRQVLEEMKKDNLQVLIDAGALMLECDNEQVAQLWLEIDPNIDAVVYFSKENDLLVKCRSEHGEEKKQKMRDMSLELSPYRERLEKCGVFLDDQHTRGTDLKFPTVFKACVTIGSRMRRDKLMQACMRMRRLGYGQSVTFYLSHEAYNKVLQLKTKSKDKKKKHKQSSAEITTQDVINWVSLNTEEYNHDGLLYWAIAGKNYAQKLAALDFHDSVDTHALEKIYTLANQCLDEEVLLLKDLYGNHMEVELLLKLIPEWFETTQRKLLSVVGCYALSQKILQKFDSIRNSVLQRIREHIPDKTYLAGMNIEEEHEKELERETEAEIEEERQVMRPMKADEVEPSLNEIVKRTVVNGGKILLKEGAIVRVCDIFEKTSFWKLIQPECWGSKVFATQDFVSVIKPYDIEHFKSDSYLRPVEYFASCQLPSGSYQLLLLSPFEVNELLPYFRKNKTATQLHMFSPRLIPNQNVLMNNSQLQIPRSCVRPSKSIPEDSRALAAILVASGNLYFRCMEEQQAFARFLGLVPRPWTSEQGSAFEKEMIKKTGFLLPKYRKQQMEHCHIELDSFQKDPISMVKKILMCRHSVISEVAHVSRILNLNWYADLPLQ